MSFKEFVRSRVFLWQLFIAVAVALGLLFISLFSLRFYTRHGEAIAIPDLYGMTQEQYIPLLQSQHLRYKVVDSTFREEVLAGGVIDQVPDAGHQVKRNRTLFLTINSRSPEQVSLPHLTDISYRQALAQLEAAGLFPGNIIYRPSEFHNLVLGVSFEGRNLEDGEQVTRGSKIDLIVGTGIGRGKITLPDLTGLDFYQARNLLDEYMLNFGAIIYDESVTTASDSATARIWRQLPGPPETREVNMGSSVDVWLSIDPARFGNNTVNEENEN